MISIIVPCYNQAQFLDECLISILNQTYINWECIVVDDGSPDDTEFVMLKWLKKDKRFRYLKKQNAWVAAARNSGILVSKGDYILPLDADDKISSNFLELSIKKIKESQSCKLVYGRAFKFGIENEEWKLEKYSFDRMKYDNLIYVTALFRKSDWEKIGGYDELGLIGGWEDWDFWLSLLKDGGKVAYIHEIEFYYRIKEDSTIKRFTRDQNLMKKNRDYLFEKHRSIYTNLSNYEMYLQTTNGYKNAQFDNRLNQMKVIDLLYLIVNKIKKRIF